MRSAVFPFAETERQIPGPPAQHYATVMERGTAKVLLSLPVRPNRQTPHTQDEIYVIVRGHGVLVHDGRRDAVASGDLLFVAAGTEHWFEDFSDDLAVWVVFYGREGGEAA